MLAELSMYYPVELSVKRRALNHSWLENGIINKRADGILSLWLDGMRWMALENDFIYREKDAKTFGENFIEAFSSANLVDLIAPLIMLPQDIREKLRQALDSLYRSDGKMMQLQADYMTALALLRENIAELRTAWDLPRPDSMIDVKKSIDQLIIAASVLKSVMEQIPKGVVIP